MARQVSCSGSDLQHRRVAVQPHPLRHTTQKRVVYDEVLTHGLLRHETATSKKSARVRGTHPAPGRGAGRHAGAALDRMTLQSELTQHNCPRVTSL
eukprot:scaffold1822_cov333-Pavlova_lutheri.AAC.6